MTTMFWTAGHYRNEIVEAETSCEAIPKKTVDLPQAGSSCSGSCPLGTNMDVGEDICSCGWNRDYFDYSFGYGCDNDEASGGDETLCKSCVKMNKREVTM
jgi:hypothetical protein